MMKEYSLKKQKEKIHRLGRTFWREDGTLQFDWSGSGLEFWFEGTYLELEICSEYWKVVENDKENWVWIAVFCDDQGKDYRRIELKENTEKVIVQNSGKKEKHKYTILKLTENVRSYAGAIQFMMEGELLAWIPKERKKIEFIGDSITCGYGNNTTEPEHPYYSSEENAFDAYGSAAARLLDMDYQAVSVSGICVTRNSGAENPYNMLGMDELYCYADRPYEEHNGKKQFTEWNFDKNHQDYVVINLGTNDQAGIQNAENSKAEQQNFRIKYRKFIETVRKKNGSKTQIICTLGSMDETLFPVICEIVGDYQKETGDTGISCFCYHHMAPEDGCGACGHPTKRTHEKMAEEIATYIRKLDAALES